MELRDSYEKVVYYLWGFEIYISLEYLLFIIGNIYAV